MEAPTFICAALALIYLANGGLAGPVDSPYVVLENGPGCVNHDFLPTSAECKTAAAAVGFTGQFHSGSWDHAPPGCHVGHPTDGWAHVYFNTRAVGRTGREIYKSICLKEAAVVPEALALTIPHPGFHHEGVCEEEDNIVYWGNDINWPNGTKIMNGSSPIAECANWCGEKEECKFWTFAKSTNRCYIKSGRSEDRRINSDRISGSKFCAEVEDVKVPETGDCFDTNTDYPGKDINLGEAKTSHRRETALDCQTLCRETDGCFFFAWAPNTNCYLKSAKSGKVFEQDAISGPQSCNAK